MITIVAIIQYYQDNRYKEQNRIETQLRYPANISTYSIHGERTALLINCAKIIVQSRDFPKTRGNQAFLNIFLYK